MKIEVMAHAGYLVIQPHGIDWDDEAAVRRCYEKTDEWTPVGPGRVGCVLANTKANLLVSTEALELLRTVKRSGDDIGDVDWWTCNDGKYAFAWLGGIRGLKDPRNITGSSSYAVFAEECQIVPNRVDDEAKSVIESKGRKPL